MMNLVKQPVSMRSSIICSLVTEAALADDRRITSGPRPLKALLVCFCRSRFLYRAVMVCGVCLFRCGLKNPAVCRVPVVVVGNLTAGGNGKTPVVIWLTRQLLARAVVEGGFRGYGGKSDHHRAAYHEDTTTALQAGDELVLIARRTGAPVAVALLAGRQLAIFAACTVDAIITDDGLRALRTAARYANRLVIDRRAPFSQWLVAALAGPMRKRAGASETDVDAVIVNGGTANPGNC